MARGSDQAKEAATTANANAGTYANNSANLYSSLAPQLIAESAHPAGFSQPDLAAMNTDAQQSAGGTGSAAVGQGLLHAARTRNAGGADAAIGAGVRDASQELSKNALGIRTNNARMKEGQRRAALGGLQGLTGTELGGSNQALGVVPDAVNADVNAENASWNGVKYILDPILAAASSGAGSFAKAGGCWIAEAIYGVDDIRTHQVRAWLNGPFRSSWFGNSVMTVYLAIGRQVAWIARRSSVLRWALRPLFDMALERARA